MAERVHTTPTKWSSCLWSLRVTAGIAVALAALQASPPPSGPLRVSRDRRSLVGAGGEPFYYMADTAWELVARLTREEAIEYLDDRAARRFTVVQMAAVTCFTGGGPNIYGDRPFDGSVDRLLRTPGAAPDDPHAYDYWDHAEFVIDEAARRGIVVALTTIWRNHVHPTDAAKPMTLANAEGFGRFLGNRFRAKPNLIWMIGGDVNAREFETEEWKRVWRSLARGVTEGATGRQRHDRILMSFHPAGPNTSSNQWHGEPWLDFNSVQTGHERDRAFPYSLIEADFVRRPAKPVVDYEPFYEDFEKPWGRSDASDMRKSAYWSVFAGAFGHAYGHVALFQMWKPQFKAWDGARMLWRDALAAEGGDDMRHLRALMESRPTAGRVPDQSLVVDTLAGAEHIRATRGSGYLFVYSPQGAPFALHSEPSPTKVREAWWFDPREGRAQRIGRLAANQTTHSFTPPTHGRGQDWVLVVDEERRRFPAPGQTAGPTTRRD